RAEGEACRSSLGLTRSAPDEHRESEQVERQLAHRRLALVDAWNLTDEIALVGGEEATKRCLPGTKFRDIHRSAQLVRGDGRAGFGLLGGRAEDLVETRQCAPRSGAGPRARRVPAAARRSTSVARLRDDDRAGDLLRARVATRCRVPWPACPA